MRSSISHDLRAPLRSIQGFAEALLEDYISSLDAIKFVASNVQPKVTIRAETNQNYFILWVEDNGIGIKPEYNEKIFGVFERLHGVESYPGTGIGLAMVRKGVERMRGECGVESQLGQGSKFWIQLPSV